MHEWNLFSVCDNACMIHVTKMNLDQTQTGKKKKKREEGDKLGWEKRYTAGYETRRKKTNEEEIIIKTVGVEATGRKRRKRKW